MIVLNVVAPNEEDSMKNKDAGDAVAEKLLGFATNYKTSDFKEKKSEESKECCCGKNEDPCSQVKKEIEEIPGIFEERDNDRLIVSYLTYIYNDVPGDAVEGVYTAIKKMLKGRCKHPNDRITNDICKAASLLSIETIDFINMSIDANEEEEDM